MKSIRAAVVLVLTLCWAGVAEASKPLLAPRRDELRAFLDQAVARALEEHSVPGAVIAVVEGAEVILVEGYGRADAERAADGRRSLFRVGSVSKLVTASAIFRLIERGELELDGAIAGRLPELRFAFSEPITPAHLLSHSSGLDVTDIGDAARSLEEVLSLEAVVRGRMPPQVRAPGRFHIYTNHGYALLGRLLEKLSGRPFPEAVDQELFSVLAMERSSFAQPLPPRLSPDLALGYELAGDELAPLPLDYSNVAPADALVTSAEDMARFMIAHLNGGVSGGRRLLRAETIAAMHRPRFRGHPEVPGWTCGFGEEQTDTTREGPGPRRILSHTGGQLGFTSELLLLPEEGIGVFICLNRRVGAARRQVVRALLEEFAPLPAAPARSPLTAVAEPERFVGAYRRLGLPQHSLEAVVELLDPSAVVRISAGEPGTLVLGSGQVLRQRGPLLLESLDGGLRVGARLGAGGGAEALFVGETGYERLAWFEDPALQRLALGLCAALLLLGLLVGPFKSVETREEGVAKWLLVAVCLLHWAFLIEFSVELALASGQGWDYGLPASLLALLYVPVVSVLLNLVLVVSSVVIWRRGAWNRAWRVAHSIVVLAGLLFCLLLLNWNLIGA